MIHEIASITIDPARAAEFEAAVARARPYFEAAKGFVSFSLKRVIENPACYQLVVGWESVEAHMVDFRASPGFQEWRVLAGPFFVEAPTVLHLHTVIA
jgi:heme-degrading monooxygenase HmoA